MFRGLFAVINDTSQTSPVIPFEMDSTAPLLSDRNDTQSDPAYTPGNSHSPSAPPLRSSSNSWTRRYLGKSSDNTSRRGPYMTLPTSPEDEELGLGPGQPWVVTSHPQDDAPGLQRYTRKAAWLCLLLTGYVIARAGSWFGIPEDGSKDLDPYDLQVQRIIRAAKVHWHVSNHQLLLVLHYQLHLVLQRPLNEDDLTKLFLFGLVLDWFARVTAEDRFAWLFHWRRWYFFAFFWGTPPVYGYVSNLPGLQHSFADISKWGPAQWGVVVGGLGALLGLVAYHLALAFGRKSKGEAVAYILSRCLVYTFFGLTTALVMHDDRYKLHLHHLYLGWAFALFAEFNTPLSALTLAITTGIFVQGIGAYSFADNLYNSNCFTVDFGTYQKMSCEYSVPQPNVTMRVCPAQAGVAITASCHY